MAKEPVQPRVVLIQDNPDYIEIFETYAKEAGVEIYKAARSMSEARSLTDELKALKVEEQLETFILLLDMNLTRGDSTGRDGREILACIREIIPNLMVILISNDEYKDVTGVIPMNPGDPEQIYQKVIKLTG